MTPGQVIIHVRGLAGSDGDRALLTADELARASAFRFEADRVRWIAARAALRSILSTATGMSPREILLEPNSFGKPLLAPPFQGIHFNLSHCRDIALIALTSDGAVGIDIEPLDRAGELATCESTFCHPLEIERLPDDDEVRNRHLLDLWTAKEALLKAIGTGLSIAPETICLRPGPALIEMESVPPRIKTSDMRVERLHHPSIPSHTAAICLPPDTNIIWQIQSPAK